MLKRKPQLNRKKKNHGFTLVEMVVCFALLGIFMIAATQVISNIVSLYYDAKQDLAGQEVSEMVLNKVTGELRKANSEITLTSSGQVAEFTQFDGSHIKISAKTASGSKQLLNIEYVDSEGNYNWRFDDKAYKGFTLKSITFAKLENKGMKVTIELQHPRLGTIKKEAYVFAYDQK